ncbi:MAG: ribosomal subunit interface protein [Gammaproteobacteria bacterium RIFCSPLOWO2_02_FULL_61_13]|nr:MAG: ribosomal subunit interface protein [Gammaproteobacteria bacterium RIFCSPLOWO2_02_FULL_61_13]
MQISVTGQNIDITPAIRAYVEEKFVRLERHFEHMTNVHVILRVERERHRAEASVHVNKADLFADHEHSDMYAAIDGLVDKLDRQVKKHKERLQDHRRGAPPKKAPEPD